MDNDTIRILESINSIAYIGMVDSQESITAATRLLRRFEVGSTVTDGDVAMLRSICDKLEQIVHDNGQRYGKTRELLGVIRNDDTE